MDFVSSIQANNNESIVYVVVKNVLLYKVRFVNCCRCCLVLVQLLSRCLFVLFRHQQQTSICLFLFLLKRRMSTVLVVVCLPLSRILFLHVLHRILVVVGGRSTASCNIEVRLLLANTISSNTSYTTTGSCTTNAFFPYVRSCPLKLLLYFVIFWQKIAQMLHAVSSVSVVCLKKEARVLHHVQRDT